MGHWHFQVMVSPAGAVGVPPGVVGVAGAQPPISRTAMASREAVIVAVVFLSILHLLNRAIQAMAGGFTSRSLASHRRTPCPTDRGTRARQRGACRGAIAEREAGRRRDTRGGGTGSREAPGRSHSPCRRTPARPQRPASHAHPLPTGAKSGWGTTVGTPVHLRVYSRPFPVSMSPRDALSTGVHGGRAARLSCTLHDDRVAFAGWGWSSPITARRADDSCF